MVIEELDYELPERLIAQYPLPARDHSKMMVFKRDSGKISHTYFYALPDYLEEGDLLVVNDTKVIKSRFSFTRPTGGKMEVFFLSKVCSASPESLTTRWECLIRPSRRVREGVEFAATEKMVVRPIERLGAGRWLVECRSQDNIYEILESVGLMPLPPYIRRDTDGGEFPDDERYQTVYGKVPGSVAAPTAGLHFTGELMGRLKEMGVRSASLCLDIGYGTFSPIRSKRVKDHKIHAEYFRITPENAGIIEKQKRKGRRIIAVGTTVVRTLETAFDGNGKPRSLEGFSDLFIYPGYRFTMTDGMITNFHLPRSSLIALVMAFCGVSEIKKCYRKAISENYRFFSYGDAMLIL